MNANSIFQIGKDHRVCEDYSLSGVTSNCAYAIVCDGCSASPDVDFGARVLAHAAKENMFFLPEKEDEYGFADLTIKQSEHVIEPFTTLHPQCLDATLLAAWTYNKNLTAYMFGDGVLVHRKKDGINSIHVHLTSGAPDYLSYTLNKKRMESYLLLENNKKEVWTSYDGIHDYKPFVPFVYQCQVEEGDSISLISDGINSFRKSDNEEIDWKDLIDEFTGFKNFTGEFVLRRISAFKRKCMKENWHHLDDISIASIVVS